MTLPQGKLDEHGLEEITGLFSSPVKPSPKKSIPIATSKDAQNSTLEASEEMAGIDSMCERRLWSQSMYYDVGARLDLHALVQVTANNIYPQALD